MRLLILGGTAWLGHRIAATAIERGHEVTCLARGTAVPAGAALVRADRDREDALAGVRAREWDAVLDVTRQPGHARRAARELEPVAARYLFVSTGNVYAAHDAVGADETAGLLPALAADAFDDPEEYGAAKVACEEAVLGAFGPARTLIARAGLIGGPGDPSGRTHHWPWRFAHPASPGRVLAPDVPELPTSVIDVRDLADWLVHCAEGGVGGVFNAMGSAVSFPDHLRAAARVAGSEAEAVTVPEAWLDEHGVQDWSGPRSMPLWLRERSWYGFNARSNARALAAGLALRPLEETLGDALAWREARVADARRDAPAGTGFVAAGFGAGLTDDEERELFAALDGGLEGRRVDDEGGAGTAG